MPSCNFFGNWIHAAPHTALLSASFPSPASTCHEAIARSLAGQEGKCSQCSRNRRDLKETISVLTEFPACLISSIVQLRSSWTVSRLDHLSGPQRPEALGPLELQLLPTLYCPPWLLGTKWALCKGSIRTLNHRTISQGCQAFYAGSGYQPQVFLFGSKNLTQRAIIPAPAGVCWAFLSVWTLHGHGQTVPSAGWGTPGGSSLKRPTDVSLSMEEQTDVWI